MRARYAHYVTAELAAQFLPKVLVKTLIRFFAALYACFSPDVGAILENLEAVSRTGRTQTGRGKPLGRAHARALIVNFSASLADLLYSREIAARDVWKQLSVRGLARIHEALEARKGVILVSAHVGHWEIGGMVLARLGFPLRAVALRHPDSRINALFERRRLAAGIRVHYVGDSLNIIFRSLARNEVVVFMADRLFTGAGIDASYFGRTVPLPAGFARIALTTGAPALPVFFVEASAGRFLMNVRPPLQFSTEHEGVQAFASEAELVIKEYPTQWYLFQPFWEKPPWPA